MMRTLVLVLACVLVAAPSAHAKKRHPKTHVAKHKKAKKAVFARVRTAPPPTRVAAVETRIEPTAPTPTRTPTPTPTRTPEAEVAPPVEHGPMGPQATDDEVPGSKMKR